MNWKINAWIIITLLGLVAATTAQPPATLSFQGRLLDSNSLPISSTIEVTFKIFQGGDPNLGGGTLAYEEEARITPDTTGIFNHAIGTGAPVDPWVAITASTFATQEHVYVEVNIDGEALLPRTLLTSSPYAFIAQRAESATDADSLGGQPATAYLTSGELSFASLSGEVTDAQVSDTLTIGASSEIAAGALPSNVTLLGATIDLDSSAEVIGSVGDAQVSDTLTIGDGSTVADGALSPNVTLLGAVIDLDSSAEVMGSLGDAQVSDTLTLGDASTVADGSLSSNVTLLGALIDLDSSAEVTGSLNDAQVSDTLTIGPSSTVASSALPPGITYLGASVDLNSGSEVTGELSDSHVSDTLTVAAGSTVSDAALSSSVTLLGATIDLGSSAEVTGTLPDANVSDDLTINTTNDAAIGTVMSMTSGSAPSTTANNLYNVGGDLHWDGMQLNTPAITPDFQAVTDQGALSTNTIAVAAVNTGHGSNELYAMDQPVQTSDAVAFASASLGISTIESDQVNLGTSGANAFYPGDTAAQVFTAGVSGNLLRIDLLMSSVSGLATEARVAIHSGNTPGSGVLLSSVESITVDNPLGSLQTYDVTFSSPATVVASHQYFIQIEPVTDGTAIQVENPGNYIGGEFWSNGSRLDAFDIPFETFVEVRGDALDIQGAVLIQDSMTAPVLSSERLYNTGGNLQWNGAPVLTGASNSYVSVGSIDLMGAPETNDLELGDGTLFVASNVDMMGCSVTGIAGGTPGRLIYLYNDGPGMLDIPVLDPRSAPNNQIHGEEFGMFSFNSHVTVTLVYDEMLQRWRVLVY